MTARALALDGPARLLDRAEIRTILAALAVPGEESRLVGGCIRDALLGTEAADLDIATTLKPEATLARAAKAGLRAIPTGFDHGTITVLVGGTTFEVTTLREDIETDGRHAVVRFGRNFVADAERRDFTINALSLDAGGQIHDTTGGIADLAQGRVRFIGDAATRIREDALRILRFFRFHARYGLGPPDEAGLSACIAAQGAVEGLSRERVRAELLKLLVAPGAVEAVTVMQEAGILSRLIGGTADLVRLARITASLPGSGGIARLAALAVRTEADSARLQDALRLSKAEAAGLSAYASALPALAERSDVDLRAMRALLACHEAAPLIEVMAVLDDPDRPNVTDDALALLQAVADERAPRPVFPLAGADLVSRGVHPGPALGRGLSAARARWLENGCPDDAATRNELIAEALRAAQE